VEFREACRAEPVLFRALGPVELSAAGWTRDLGPARQRTVLAVLLVEAGRLVPVPAVIDRVWDDQPPRQVRATLHSYVARLRRTLALAGTGPAQVRLLHQSGGYRLEIDPERVDVHRFRRLVRQARAAADDPAARAALLEEALQLWHGTPLAGLSGDWVARTRYALDQQRVTALVDWVYAGLRLDRHCEVIDELSQRLADYPYAEPLVAALMRALDAAGQRTEALACYSRTRRQLLDGRGVEPGPALRRLHETILRGVTTAGSAGPAAPTSSAVSTGSAAGSGDLGDLRSVADLAGVLRGLRRREARQRGGPELTYRELAARTGWARATIGEYLTGVRLPPTDRFDTLVRLLGTGPAETGALATARDRVAELRRAGPPPVPPRELPPDVSSFTGRGEQLAALERAAAGSPPVAAVVGMAGVGKTALAVRWAHQVADRFPDGQVYIDLRGYHPAEPVPADQALAILLGSLGVAGPDLPAEEALRAAQYRTLTASRRMLIVLDNAESADQVRPLLPGTPSCLVVVTSRDDLAGLVARDGADRVRVDPLPLADAARLLTALVGGRAEADPAATVRLAQRCARLPLALRVAAELAAARPDVRLAELVEELAGTRRLARLSGLGAVSDPPATVTEVFSWSMRHLPAEVATAFWWLGRQPGPDLGVAAAAALFGTDPEAARQRVERLARAHLAERAQLDRYQVPDLLRAYAGGPDGAGRDGEPAAMTRLFAHYLATAAAAMDVLFPHERDDRPPPPRADRPSSDLSAPAALRWLDAERANLVAVCGHAAGQGWPEVAVDLSRTLWRYLDTHGHYRQAYAIHQHAVRAARPGSGELADVLAKLGVTAWRLGHCPEAERLLERAAAIHRELGGEPGEARVRILLAMVDYQLGRFPDAAERLRQAVSSYRRLGDRRGEAGALGNLGVLHWRQGRSQLAIACQRRAGRIGRQLADPYVEGYALANLGLVYQQLGRLPEALDSHQRALASSRELGDRRAEADVLGSLGATYRSLGRFPEAVDHLVQALALARELGHRGLDAELLNHLGETLAAMGERGPAGVRHAEAHAVAVAIGDRYEQARALDGLAVAWRQRGQRGRAARHRRAARAIYAELGVPIRGNGGIAARSSTPAGDAVAPNGSASGAQR
jgi:DNA-binding SARP family transcriptional activator/tetratricopeptide (TPR) repeat protein